MRNKAEMKWKLFLFSCCIVLPQVSIGQLSVDLDNYRYYITAKGPAQLGEFSMIGKYGNGWATLNVKMNYGSWGGNGGYRDWNRIYCPSDVRVSGIGSATEAEAQKFLQWANSYLATNPRALPNNPGYDPAIGTAARVDEMILGCYVSVDGTSNGDYVFAGIVRPETVEIVNPPPVMGACSLSSQNLNLNYSSTSLNVGGLTQNTNLNITCTSGDAQNYQLKLTGNDVTNGRLKFNNEVSAQVYLNGIQVQANGTGILLNNLTSQTIPVSATLIGTAATSGVSNAAGVLILEAQ